MKKLCSLLISMFAFSMSAWAGGDWHMVSIRGLRIDLSVDPYERHFLGNRDVPNAAEMLIPSPRGKEKSSPFEALDARVNGLDIKARTYRFTGHLSFGRVQGNFIGHGAGLTYRMNENSSVVGAVSYDRATRTGGFAIVFSSVFF